MNGKGLPRYQPIDDPYMRGYTEKVPDPCCSGLCVPLCFAYYCVCCLLCLGGLITLGVMIWFCWPLVPTFEKLDSTLTTRTIVVSPPKMVFTGNTRIRANSTARIEIPILGYEFNVTYRTFFVDTIMYGDIGTIAPLASTVLTIPFSISPKDPNAAMITQMAADRIVQGYVTLGFSGNIKASYLSVPFTYPYSYTADLQI